MRTALPHLILLLLLLGQSGSKQSFAADGLFEIHVIDEQSQRGIPLVELTTVNDVTWVTDNAGRVAYSEQDHFGQQVFFRVRAQGYEVPRDGFGITGIRCQVQDGGQYTLRLRRTNAAERLYRVSGEGRYRDSRRLGYDIPLANPLDHGQVAGQDSVQAALYRGKIRWFWGDTNRMSYPLGLFRTAGAVSDLPDAAVLSHDVGINLRYFTRPDGFVRAMADVPDPQGVVWIDGVTTVPAEDSTERLVCHFSRRKGLASAYEHGLMVYNDSRDLFEVASTLPLDETWRFISNHPTRIEERGQSYVLFGLPYLTTRVPARLESVLDPDQYESWSCIDLNDDPATAKPRRDSQGKLLWRWQAGPPVTQQVEHRWLKAGLIDADEARFLPVDVDQPSRHVLMHSGTVYWNEHRKRWILIAIEFATGKHAPSMLGEVWCSESESPQGPFRSAVRIVTHDRQSFYNPCHHPFFDSENGRVIYFEGTYCNTFTTSPPTPRYNYNQIMYRLDLDDPQVRKVRARDSSRTGTGRDSGIEPSQQ